MIHAGDAVKQQNMAPVHPPQAPRKQPQLIPNGVRSRKKEQEAADEVFARQIQEEEKKKSQTPAAASAKRLPEVDRQMDRLKKDAADLKQANICSLLRQQI